MKRLVDWYLDRQMLMHINQDNTQGELVYHFEYKPSLHETLILHALGVCWIGAERQMQPKEEKQDSIQQGTWYNLAEIHQDLKRREI